MKPLITWRYFIIPENAFDSVKKEADEIDGLRNRELSDEENNRKESLIEALNEKAEKIAMKTIVYSDSEEKNDGTVIEELVYLMDKSPEVSQYSQGYYFQFLVYAPPGELQKEYKDVEKVFDIISSKNLLKKEFLGEWKYLDRAKEIFEELRKMLKEAYENKCGVIMTDVVIWESTPEDEEEEDTEEEASVS
jgi:hypothetical protein